MGVGVSNWRLARAVSMRGQLGVVSGTALDTILVRRLQDGDRDGHVRRAMQAFPISGVADTVREQFFIEGGRAPDAPYALVPMYRRSVSVARQQLTILANFVEVFLAKEGHDGLVGTNLLTKLQLPNLASLYGAMLAGVDYVLMGAGIPREIPSALDALAVHHPARLTFEVDGARGETQTLEFDPVAHGGDINTPLKRPKFLAIVASDTLAINLARKSSGYVDGFVVEGPTAGGHNAPPRGALTLTARGEPLYGERDVVDIEKVRSLGRPFWLAGGTGSPTHVAEALAAGAAGVQVGTLFAYCDESGFDDDLKREVLTSAKSGELRIMTDPLASPTGYPFKVVTWGDHVDEAVERERVCDLGYLRSAYQREDGRIGYRCAAEPVADYVQKGGNAEDTVGRRCVCNGLVSTVGMPQIREGRGAEPALVTSGDDLANIGSFLGDRVSYSAGDVIDYLLPNHFKSNRSAFMTLDHAVTNV
jgi:NAD(P)H-dependent flavin oxidoreductase YrpB (nitropropane dioxygenase family)